MGHKSYNLAFWLDKVPHRLARRQETAQKTNCLKELHPKWFSFQKLDQLFFRIGTDPQIRRSHCGVHISFTEVALGKVGYLLCLIGVKLAVRFSRADVS